MSVNANARPRRGRPSGKNRVPLTAEQRRARNALYERERRQGLGTGYSDLAEAVGCSSDLPSYELLKMVETILKMPKQQETVEELTEQNRALEDEIATLEEQIKINDIKDWLLQPRQDVLNEETISQAKKELEEKQKQTENEIAKLEDDREIEKIKEWLLAPF
ncbi:hypothetical protein MSG28_014293 [Choristoneura fumiferana]|uniref:Uncharacterized protein n=2 Tax=Choristoneura fumiferana TaxID=7141 RepID=A0ACC0JGJ6_CHOFU|nr:hypothetical protein MSG28_014292 [Choristoneura fumiferana]KAI8423264.1 hypothetical protein MSG28_014293 [Choristoneura fumiferana]